MRYLLALALLVSTTALAAGQDDGYPRYASLKRSEVNVRSGPGNQYPILWVYQRIGYPVQVLAKFDNYYKVRDLEGEEGWVFSGLVSLNRTSVITGAAPADLHRRADTTSDVVARLSPGVVVELKECAEATSFCKVETAGLKGWLSSSNLVWVNKL